MNVQTISAPVDEAKAKLAEYRAALKKRFNKTDEILVRTYRELAKGNMIVNALDAIVGAGVDELHRPKMAIARADATHVWYRRSITSARRGNWDQISSFFSDTPRLTKNSYEFARNQFADCPENCQQCIGRRVSRFKAIVPLIPPQFRPPHRLSNYHILWDTEGAWESEPPTDPFLLKRISGDLFTVLAVWDLTELERIVLKGIRARTN